jgi:hypothetical protein
MRTSIRSKSMNKRVFFRVRKNPSDVRIVHNKLLGGWYVVRGPHQTPLNGRFNSKQEAQEYLQRNQMRKNPSTARKIGNLQTVGATIRKNREGEWVVRLWINGKHYEPADYFASGIQDAMETAQDMVKRASAGIGVNPSASHPEIHIDIDSHNVRSQEEMMRANPSDVLGGKSIKTEYFGPGNVRGARIKASVIDGNKIQASMSVSYPHELDMYAAHIFAAEAMRDKMGWKGDLIGVQTQTGYVFGFKEHGSSRFGFSKNPTLRASRPAKRKLHSRTHYDAGTRNLPGMGKIYVQKKHGTDWMSIAVAPHTNAGRKAAEFWAQRYHRKHPGSTLRLFV